MNKLRTFLLALGIVMFSSAMVPAESAKADSSTEWNDGTYYFNGVYAGTPYGYGYFSPSNWPVNYWMNSIMNGYSFYPYYNYQPYYASFAAISYSPATDVFGYSFGQASRQNATWDANYRCGVADCRPVVWVQGACAVVVTSASTGRLTWAYSSTTRDAGAWALRSCANAGNGTLVSDCVARVWTCSY